MIKTPKCEFLDVAPDKGGAVRVRKEYVYPCRFPIPAMPDLPVSVTGMYGFKPIAESSKRKVSSDECAECPCHSARAK